MTIPIPTPDITQATQQLSSSTEGSVIVYLFIIIFIALSSWIYFNFKKLKQAEEDKKKSDEQNASVFKKLDESLNRLADVQEITMDFIKETVEHERKNHEECKDKFYNKLVEIENYIKNR